MNSGQKRPYLFYGAAALVFLTFWVIFWLNYFNFLSIPFLPSKKSQTAQKPRKAVQTQTTPTQTAEQPSKNLETCSITKEGNPLVDGEIRKLKDKNGEIVVSTFRGNINKYNYDATKSSSSLELISPKGDQSYTFVLKEEKGLVYDAIDLKDLTLKDLKIGQTVVLSFNCFTYKPENEQFRITRVAVTGK